ncbi:MAG: NIPSNAP family protein [Candidatus Acidiferrum sp.]|jgi:NIPSNAP protein
MQRRTFLTSSLAAAALGSAPVSNSQSATSASGAKGRLYYELRRYQLSSGPQKKLCDDFFQNALIPAANRLGITPVGVFNLAIGPETPTIYVLLPSPSLETLVSAEAHLAQDADYMKTGAPFLNAPAVEPAFNRLESSLMIAFEKIPGVTLPAATATNGPRVFELRTYESATDQDHKRKVEMMQSGEEAIFAKSGFSQVFYSDTLIGPRLPNLTYMLSYESLAVRDKLWSAFANAPEWKAMQALPRYAFENIVSNITNLILTPAPYSQI